jgi:hypothetical protein
MGDIILDVKMLKKKVKFSDGCVPTGWDIDIHRPHKEFQKGFKNNEFIAQAQHTNYSRPFWIPYRALYSRNIENLFMAGRNISVTHEALGSVRVMRTGGMMGEVIGMAAALCKNHGVNPRKIYETYWDEMRQLMTQGVGKKQE